MEIRTDRDGGVAIVTLAAPDRRNALTVEMAQELTAVCEALDADPGVGAVVIAAEGKTFCAGGDRATLAAAGEDPAAGVNFAGLTAIYRAFTRVGELEAPTIAAVAGHAVGAGLNLALATDLRVVARDVVLTSGFIPIGLHPGGGHTALLGRTGAREAAAALALFGEKIDGTRAVELGLAWRAVETGQVLETAVGLARIPAADPEMARRTARSLRLVNGPPALPWPAALEAERAAQMWSMRRKASPSSSQ